MSDETPSTPLADQALQRLKKLAEGNGLADDVVHFFSAEEKNYDIEGTVTLTPLFETAGGSYAGPPRGSKRKLVASSAALRSEVERLKQDFEGKPTWIADALAQLKDQPGGGWGLDDVRISLPKLSTALAAATVCPTCQGARLLTCHQCNAQGVIICPQCQGHRQEVCPICNGSGKNPLMQDQNCINCNGYGRSPCRFCQGHGQLACPTCHGQRGTPCPACKGTGGMTEEVAITYGARTQFKIKGDGLPSGLRRGLDRLGLAKLADGHADIESFAPVDEDEGHEEPVIAGAPQGDKKEKTAEARTALRRAYPLCRYADELLRQAGDGRRLRQEGRVTWCATVPRHRFAARAR